MPTTIENDETVIEISSAYGTMWYLLVETGDLNNDDNVDFVDYSKLSQYWLQDEQSVDISKLPFGDGIVDFEDLAVIIRNWLEGIY